MTNPFAEMIEKNRLMWDRQNLVLQGYTNVGQVAKGCLAGEKDLVDLKEAEIEVGYNADFGTELKGAREIIAELKSTKRAADYNGDSDKSKACQRIINKYMPEGIEELIAGK